MWRVARASRGPGQWHTVPGISLETFRVTRPASPRARHVTHTQCAESVVVRNRMRGIDFGQERREDRLPQRLVRSRALKRRRVSITIAVLPRRLGTPSILVNFEEPSGVRWLGAVSLSGTDDGGASVHSGRNDSKRSPGQRDESRVQASRPTLMLSGERLSSSRLAPCLPGDDNPLGGGGG